MTQYWEWRIQVKTLLIGYQHIHIGHMGIEKSKQLECGVLFWQACVTKLTHGQMMWHLPCKTLYKCQGAHHPPRHTKKSSLKSTLSTKVESTIYGTSKLSSEF